MRPQRMLAAIRSAMGLALIMSIISARSQANLCDLPQIFLHAQIKHYSCSTYDFWAQ